MVCGDNPIPFRTASNSEVKAKTEEEATVICTLQGHRGKGGRRLSPGMSSKVATDGPFEAVWGKPTVRNFRGEGETRSSIPAASGVKNAELTRPFPTDVRIATAPERGCNADVLQTILRRMLIAQTAAVKGPCPETLGRGCHRSKVHTMSTELPEKFGVLTDFREALCLHRPKGEPTPVIPRVSNPRGDPARN